MNRFFRKFDAALRHKSAPLSVAVACALTIAIWFAWPVHAQRTASNPFGAQLNVQDAGTCSTTNSFAWQTLPSNAGITSLNLSGTFTATITVRESNNGGTTWTTINTLTTTGTTTYGTNGFTDFCADVTAFTSGIVQVSITTGTQSSVASGNSALAGGAGANQQVLFNSNGSIGSSANLSFNGVLLTAANSTVTGTFTSQAYQTSADCASAASPAVCGIATAGQVVIAAAATTVQVNTANVTAASIIILTEDDSAGARLGVTCNTTSLGATKISARTSGSNFTITTATAPTTNPACLNFWIIN